MEEFIIIKNKFSEERGREGLKLKRGQSLKRV